MLMGTAVLISGSTLMTILTLYINKLKQFAQSYKFKVLTFLLLIFAPVLSFVLYFKNNPILRNVVFGITFSGATALIMLLSAQSRKPSSVLISLFSVIGILCILAVSGIRMTHSIHKWKYPLFVILIMVILASYLNRFIFQSEVYVVVVSAICIVLFSIFVVYDVNRAIQKQKDYNAKMGLGPDENIKDVFKIHTKGNLHAPICKNAVFNIWLNFANLFIDTLYGGFIFGRGIYRKNTKS